jgi:hypothetical protein
MELTPMLTALLVALAGPLAAQVINIDFDESSTTALYQGLAAAPDPSGSTAIWNRVTGAGTNVTISGSNLIESDGDATGVGISVDVFRTYLGVPPSQEVGGVTQGYFDLMSDYVYLSAPSNSQVVTLSGSITGLDPSRLYDIYLYGQGDDFIEDDSPGQNTLFSIGGVFKQTSWDGVSGGDGLMEEGIEYVKFSVMPDLLGRIGFSYANVVSGPGGNAATDLDGVNSRYAAINGIQIVDVAAVVPEPSSALLGAFGLLAMRRRRR